MSDVATVDRWFKSRETLYTPINSYEIKLEKHPTSNQALTSIMGQGTAYYLEDHQKKKWVLKKLTLATHKIDVNYLKAVKTLLLPTNHIPFASGYERTILDKTSHTSKSGLYFDKELAIWMDKTIFMPRVIADGWDKILIEIRDQQLILTDAQRLRLCQTLVENVQILESNGIAHRDLSSTNIMIDPHSWDVHFIDWDTLYHQSLSLPAETTTGTQGYISPFIGWKDDKNIGDPSKTWNVHADRFAMALLIFEFLSVDDFAPLGGDGGIFNQIEIGDKTGPNIDYALTRIRQKYPEAEKLFLQALHATSFADCPSPGEWLNFLDNWKKPATNTAPQYTHPRPNNTGGPIVMPPYTPPPVSWRVYLPLLPQAVVFLLVGIGALYVLSYLFSGPDPVEENNSSNISPASYTAKDTSTYLWDGDKIFEGFNPDAENEQIWEYIDHVIDSLEGARQKKHLIEIYSHSNVEKAIDERRKTKELNDVLDRLKPVSQLVDSINNFLAEEARYEDSIKQERHADSLARALAIQELNDQEIEEEINIQLEKWRSIEKTVLYGEPLVQTGINDIESYSEVVLQIVLENLLKKESLRYSRDQYLNPTPSQQQRIFILNLMAHKLGEWDQARIERTLLSIPNPGVLKDESPTYTSDELTKHPDPYFRPSRYYPPNVTEAGLMGSVVLRIVVNKYGLVEEVGLVKSHPPFDRFAIEEAMRFKYKPAEYYGKPVKTITTWRATFIPPKQKPEDDVAERKKKIEKIDKTLKEWDQYKNRGLVEFTNPYISPDGRTIFGMDNVSKGPRIIHYPKDPDWTNEQKAALPTTVTLKVLINSRGEVEKANVVQHHDNPLFDAIGIEYIFRCRFSPAKRFNSNVKVYRILGLIFPTPSLSKRQHLDWDGWYKRNPEYEKYRKHGEG